ncbi:unnamed protein product [Nippostrongylus brasiliensis]|uniref:Ovule protein n=1 Tax=Nippostrongylus brasiliensis TaxID=27835 RepID=A0A0N4XY25_NIPBR|nr:unnamed protein product [Nippostrongylus brasiliensis]
MLDALASPSRHSNSGHISNSTEGVSTPGSEMLKEEGGVIKGELISWVGLFSRRLEIMSEEKQIVINHFPKGTINITACLVQLEKQYNKIKYQETTKPEQSQKDSSVSRMADVDRIFKTCDRCERAEMAVCREPAESA